MQQQRLLGVAITGHLRGPIVVDADATAGTVYQSTNLGTSVLDPSTWTVRMTPARTAKRRR